MQSLFANPFAADAAAAKRHCAACALGSAAATANAQGSNDDAGETG